MEIEAHFSEIRETIAGEIDNAKRSIVAAVAWITEPMLFDPLVAAARRGVSVQVALLQDSINRQSPISFERLTAAGGRICWIPETGRRAGSLHHKFCVIDREVVITGSFNWTRRASKADENIVVVRGDEALTAGFEEAFQTLLEKYGHDAAAVVVDTLKLMQRLEIIRNLLTLEDEETLAGQIPRLESARSVPTVAGLIALLKAKDWSNAKTCVGEILARGMAVTQFNDPEIAELRLEAMALEAELVALSAEQAELENLIRDFDRRQHDMLGDVLAECLRLRHETLRLKAAQSAKREDQDAEKQADEEYANYQHARDEAGRELPAHTLNEEERTELKRLYRAAAMRCHPDRVGDEDKAAAQALFIQVQQAYREGDLDALRRVHALLDQGRAFADPIRTATEKDQLQNSIARFALQVAELVRVIRGLRASETYRTLSSITAWDDYFATARQRLETECATLRQQLKETING